MVEREAQLEQQAALEHAGRHGRIADRAQQDRVVAAQFLEHGVGQHFTRAMPSRRTEVVARGVHAGQHGIEHAQGLVGHLDADTVPGHNR